MHARERDKGKRESLLGLQFLMNSLCAVRSPCPGSDVEQSEWDDQTRHAGEGKMRGPKPRKATEMNSSISHSPLPLEGFEMRRSLGKRIPQNPSFFPASTLLSVRRELTDLISIPDQRILLSVPSDQFYLTDSPACINSVLHLVPLVLVPLSG